MLEKFDGTRSNFRGFVKEVRLLIYLQHNCYPDGASQVGLVGTLITFGDSVIMVCTIAQKRVAFTLQL